MDCVNTGISNLASEWLLWKWYMVDKTSRDGRKLRVGLEEFMVICHCRMINTIGKTPSKTMNLVLVGLYFIAPILLCLFLTMCSMIQ
jgi:hypothetical protein